MTTCLMTMKSRRKKTRRSLRRQMDTMFSSSKSTLRINCKKKQLSQKKTHLTMAIISD